VEDPYDICNAQLDQLLHGLRPVKMAYDCPPGSKALLLEYRVGYLNIRLYGFPPSEASGEDVFVLLISYQEEHIFTPQEMLVLWQNTIAQGTEDLPFCFDHCEIHASSPGCTTLLPPVRHSVHTSQLGSALFSRLPIYQNYGWF